MKRYLHLFVFALSIFAIIGCSSDPEIVERIVEVEKEKIVEVENDPGKLVIYSGRKESLVGPIINQFADATGIEVEVKYGSSAPIAALLMEEGDKSPADIFYA